MRNLKSPDTFPSWIEEGLSAFNSVSSKSCFNPSKTAFHPHSPFTTLPLFLNCFLALCSCMFVFPSWFPFGLLLCCNYANPQTTKLHFIIQPLMFPLLLTLHFCLSPESFKFNFSSFHFLPFPPVLSCPSPLPPLCVLLCFTVLDLPRCGQWDICEYNKTKRHPLSPSCAHRERRSEFIFNNSKIRPLLFRKIL